MFPCEVLSRSVPPQDDAQGISWLCNACLLPLAYFALGQLLEGKCEIHISWDSDAWQKLFPPKSCKIKYKQFQSRLNPKAQLKTRQYLFVLKSKTGTVPLLRAARFVPSRGSITLHGKDELDVGA